MNPKPQAHDPNYQGTGKLNGKVALITGGDSGIGRAVAFVKEAANCFVFLASDFASYIRASSLMAEPQLMVNSYGTFRFAKKRRSIDMNKIVQRFILITAAMTLSGCPLTVNLNVSTDQPIALSIDKPIELKLGADIAVTKLPPVKADVKVTTLAPVKVGIAHSDTPNSTDKEK